MTNLSRLIASLAVISALTAAPAVLAAAETLRVPVMRPSGGISEVRYYSGERLIARDTVDELMRITKREGAIPDGRVVENYPQGGLHFRWKMRSGRYDGLKQEYAPDGRLIAEWTLANGSKEGPAKTYHRNGTVKAELNYENNRLNGVCTVYNDDGTLKEKALFADGREDVSAREVYTRTKARSGVQPRRRQQQKSPATRNAPAAGPSAPPAEPRSGEAASPADTAPQSAPPGDNQEPAIQDTTYSTDPSFTPLSAGGSAVADPAQ